MALVDSGATSHYVTESAPVYNKCATTPIHVGLPDGSSLQATRKAKLPFANLPEAAQDAYIVDNMQKNLISIGKLCNAGCTAIFTKNDVKIRINNDIVLQGNRNPQHGLWEVPMQS